jgi:hypothetical protein
MNGVNASTAYSVLDYLTVTSITTTGAMGSTTQIGTNGIASTPWVRFDGLAGMAQIAIQATVSGAVNYTLQSTLDNPNRIIGTGNPLSYALTPAQVTWVSTTDTNAVAATGSVQTNYAYPPTYARVLLNSGSGTVTTTFQQAYTG